MDLLSDEMKAVISPAAALRATGRPLPEPDEAMRGLAPGALVTCH